MNFLMNFETLVLRYFGSSPDLRRHFIKSLYINKYLKILPTMQTETKFFLPSHQRRRRDRFSVGLLEYPVVAFTSYSILVTSKVYISRYLTK